MSPANKALVRRFVDEAVDRGGARRLAELIAADHVRHGPDGDLFGPEGVGVAVGELRTGFPDLLLDLVELIADADRVAYRFVLRGTHAGPFLGIPPTGRAVAPAGMAIERLAESWVHLDLIGLRRQLGIAR